MNKAVFIDRDGVINRERGEYTYRIEDTEILDGVAETMRAWQQRGYLLIVVSNQSGIAKGIYSHEDVEALHNYLLMEMKKKEVNIAEIYYCPHHPDTGRCLCRKPGTLLLEKAIARFSIDVTRSWLIGDRPRDVEAAKSIGLKGILIESNSPLPAIREMIK